MMPLLQHPPTPSTAPSSAATAAASTGMSEKGKQTSRGRQKIAIAAIGQKNKKHVTFSKRRLGLFKKASELCVLCGAEVAIITFSEAGKAFCFGHPSADAVIRRYLYGTSSSSSSSSAAAAASGSASSSLSSSTPPPNLAASAATSVLVNDYAAMLHEYNEEYKRVKREMKRYSAAGDDSMSSEFGSGSNNVGVISRGVGFGGFWWEQSIDGLEPHELEQYLASLIELKENVTRRVEELGKDDDRDCDKKEIIGFDGLDNSTDYNNVDNNRYNDHCNDTHTDGVQLVKDMDDEEDCFVNIDNCCSGFLNHHRRRHLVGGMDQYGVYDVPYHLCSHAQGFNFGASGQ